MAEKNSLGLKICEIMERVQYIKKNGLNKFNNYTYATEADVQDAVRKEMAKRHVFMYPDVLKREIREHTNRKGNKEYIGTVDIKFTFIDADSGESIAFTMVGEGEDALDKAFYKAIAGTQKYALMKLFMIPTGDDPERDNNAEKETNEQPILISTDQKKEIESIWKSNAGSLDGMNEWIDKFFKKTIDKLTQLEAQSIISKLGKSRKKEQA